jgi:hypothetical protein
MTHKLKTFGFALVAVLALNAAIAASASAWFTWEEEEKKDPPIATGSSVGFQLLYNEKEELTCKAVSFDNGTVFGGVITATPTFNECTLVSSGGTLTAFVEMTSCDFEFHTDWAMGIVCPNGTEAHVSVTVLGVKTKCLTIPSQSQGGSKEKTVTYSNTGSGATADVDVEVNVKGLEYKRGGVCGSGTFEDGGYIGEITVKGDDQKTKNQIGISWDEH